MIKVISDNPLEVNNQLEKLEKDYYVKYINSHRLQNFHGNRDTLVLIVELTPRVHVTDRTGVGLPDPPTGCKECDD